MKINASSESLKHLNSRPVRMLLLAALSLCVSSRLWGAPSFTISPAAVSNGYTGFITLQITGLANGEQVKIGKFLDANGNSAVDSEDPMIQAFGLTDGQASLIGGATNLNVPGDSTAADGAITARMSCLAGGFDQQLVGKYAYVVTSPSGSFTPLTNWFQVTNAGLAQSFTGAVRCSGTNVPYAAVMLFTPPSGQGGMNPVGGVLADSSGTFRVEALPGTYMLWAFKSNFVADLSTAPVLAVTAGATVNTNVALLPGTQTISGRVVDAGNTNRPLRGLSVFWMSSNQQISSGFTDTNGNFTVAALPGQWEFGGDSQVFSFLGYLASKNYAPVDTSTGSVAGLTLTVPKATALLYGSVRDTQNRPLAGVGLSAGPNNGSGSFEGNGISDAEGNYAIGVTSGAWSLHVNQDGSTFANYIFSRPFDSTNLNGGQAVLANINAMPATCHLAGYVKDTGNQPVAGLGVYATAVVNGVSYDKWTETDATGFYSLALGPGSWSVNLDCSGGSNGLESRGYLCVQNQNVNLQSGDQTLNFTVTSPSSQVTGFIRDTFGNPIANVGVSAWESSSGFNAYAQTDPTGHFTLHVPNGTFNVNVSCSGSSDSLGQLGYFCVDQQTVSVSNSTAIVNFNAYPAPYQLSGIVHNSTNGPVANVGVSVSATLNGSPVNAYTQTDANGYYSFRVAAATWTVNLSCNSGTDSLTAQGYLCVEQQTVNVSTGNVTVNIQVTSAPCRITGHVRDNLGNPIPAVGVYAWMNVNGTNLNAWASTDGGGQYTLLVANGTWNVNVSCGGGNGSLDQLGYLCVGNQTVGVTNSTATADFTTVPGSYQVSGNVVDSSSRPLTNIGVYATATIGNLPFAAYVTTDAAGYYRFRAASGTWVIGLDCSSLSAQSYVCPGQQTNTLAGGNLVVNFTVQPRLPLQITTTSLPDATVGLYYSQPLQATGGQAPYLWELTQSSGPLPAGLNLSLNGIISGVPGSTGNFNFSIRAYDTASGADNAYQSLSLRVTSGGPSVQLSGAKLLPSGQLQFSFNTAQGQTYTVEYSSNLTNWTPAFTLSGTGAPVTNSFPAQGPDPRRFYRVHLGQ